MGWCALREGGSGEGMEEKATRVPLAKRLQEDDSHWAGHTEVCPGWGCSPAEDWAPLICLVFYGAGDSAQGRLHAGQVLHLQPAVRT